MSTAEVRRRYRREIAAAQQLFDPLILPPAPEMERWRTDMLCDTCSCDISIVYTRDNGKRDRRCVKCEEAAKPST